MSQQSRNRSPQGERNQAVPVRLYEDGDRIMLATPMPGLQAENISVLVSGTRVTVHGEQRGPAENDGNQSRVLLDEWTPGPYHRELDLPEGVNGAEINATYGNGVLVLAMPKARKGQGTGRTEFRLKVTESTRGEHWGHVGGGLSERPR